MFDFSVLCGFMKLWRPGFILPSFFPFPFGEHVQQYSYFCSSFTYRERSPGAEVEGVRCAFTLKLQACKSSGATDGQEELLVSLNFSLWTFWPHASHSSLPGAFRTTVSSQLISDTELNTEYTAKEGDDSAFEWDTGTYRTIPGNKEGKLAPPFQQQVTAQEECSTYPERYW